MRETLEFLSITKQITLMPEDPRFFPTTTDERGQDDPGKKPQTPAIAEDDHAFIPRWWPCVLESDD